jgi:transcriptional regulator with XRE-family HTH domain
MAISLARGRQACAVTSKRVDLTWETFARELGLNLLRARQATGLSQERIAHAAGIAAYTYQKFEKGESKPGSPMNPRLNTLVALSQVLEVPLVDLLPRKFPDLTAGR